MQERKPVEGAGQWERCFPNAFMEYNHVTVEELSRDRAVCSLALRPESMNPYGYAHGGAFYTIADDVTGLAAHSDGRAYVTQTSTLYFLANRKSGVLKGVGTVRRRGQTTCLVDVEITADDGTLLATGSFVYFCVDRRTVPELLRESAGNANTSAQSEPAAPSETEPTPSSQTE